jgi:uncharacterized Zn finger protein
MNTPVTIVDEQLIALAGAAAFARGENYYSLGRVIGWTRKGTKILARVAGNLDYEVTLTYSRGRLEGYCNCPASEGFDFCKHCVAAAMQYREDSNQQARLEDGSVEQRIEAHLNKLDRKEIGDHLLGLILADPELRQQWSIRADVALNRMDARAIKKRITAAIPYNKHLFRYPQVRSYFNKVQPIVDLLEQQLLQLQPESGLQLVEYALQRIHRALESIDDSGGFRLELMARLQNLHQATLWRLDWDKPRLVAYLRQLDAGQYADMYPDFPHAYRDLLAGEGMALVYGALQAEWEALPALKPGAGWERRYPYLQLQHLLRQRAEAAGDTRAVIQLVQKTATEERHFLELCDLCMEVGDWEQVEYFLAHARECDQSDRHARNSEYRLERTQQRLLVQQGRLDQALDLQWQIFQGSLAVEDYGQLLELAEKLKKKERYGDKARQWLREKLIRAEPNRFSTRYADALLEIALHENNVGMALEVCEQQSVAAGLIAKLARSCRDLPEAAIPLYARLVAFEVQGGKNAAYRRGVDWMLEAQELATTEAARRVFRETLQSLRSEFKAKRNFIQFLNEAFYS